MLSGRCYERESVPYKALDSLIDALARHLKGLPARETASLLAAGRGVPGPGLPGVAERRGGGLGAPRVAGDARPAGAAAAGVRRAARTAEAAGERRPLVLAIDDLQWGDVDSAILLSDLLCSPQSPVLLFIGSFRSEDVGTKSVPERDPQVDRRRARPARPSRAGRRGR